MGVFYGIDWSKNRPNVYLLNSRKMIDKVYGKETQDWMVGWSDGRNVYLLDRENYEKESKHKYSDDEYFKLLKHELTHLFYKILTFSDKPRWLSEGVSVYTSGQIEDHKKLGEFNKFLDYYDKWDGKAYMECGLFIKVLTDKFGKDKTSLENIL